jgi:UDP-N-acetylglucosamine--N-acetylmuramyl-(pentapeptide) pyrophosphoryl-undecaprenol N-acetylglucosamine transferase
VRALLVASTGGHLRELHHLLPRFVEAQGDRLWVTNDSLQSRELLAGENVVYVPYQGSRNAAEIVANLGRARGVVKGRRFDVAVSTGSAIAMSFLPVAAAHGAPGHYIESCTRVGAPSITGRVLRGVPGVHCYVQHERAVRPGWRFGGSVLDGFRAVPRPEPTLRRVAVTLGTWRQPFRRLLDRLVEVLPPTVEVVAQTGHTDAAGLPVRAVPWLSPGELRAELRGADVVVTHAGMGNTLDALEAGKLPVVVPRRRAYREQVDDHQTELAVELGRLGLAVARDVIELTLADLVRASGRRIEQDEVPRFRLHAPR